MSHRRSSRKPTTEVPFTVVHRWVDGESAGVLAREIGWPVWQMLRAMAKYAPARRKMAAYRAALEDISARSSDPLPAILRTRRNNLLSLARLEAVLEDPSVDLTVEEIRSFGELNIALGSFELAICDRLQAIEAQRREAVTDDDRAARKALPECVGADDDGGEWDVVADPSEGEGPSGTG